MKILFCLVVIFFVAFASARSIPEFDTTTLMKFLPQNLTEKNCITTELWNWKKSQMPKTKSALNCPIEGLCDVPNIRNLWVRRQMKIQLVFNVVCAAIGQCPFGSNEILGQLQQINIDFSGTGLSFEVVETNYLYNSRLADISPYGGNNQWYNDIREIKQLMAVKPKEYLNVFCSRQRSGFSGTLLGIGTFPWDPESNTAYGGLWVNANYIGLGETTAAHEIGHNVGLWHTFHGTAEVTCTSPCYEVVHNETDDITFPNTVGDFCADTLSQPVNYFCSAPTSSDCRGTRYNDIDRSLLSLLTNNIMSYTPDSCQTELTQQQASRAHCWVCDRLSDFDPDSCTL
jgi:hypothetical protein